MYEYPFEVYTCIVDGTPDNYLCYQLAVALEKEQFELAAYIRDTISQRQQSFEKRVGSCEEEGELIK
ncbi:UvrB/UvrC motif-containing protein [Telluribacter humicola]|uniref:UvrB/UvrC motif-containing protein n=1 Tax=Telluribacter humicola TaxID=1720261 RepID=UPI001A95FEFB|nr:UvrB/UvrC motif-containing protein [Telluribacter humicola]